MKGKQYVGHRDDAVVYLVDGKAVRDRFDSDFSQGGHGYVYKWIPKGEIWLDVLLSVEERPYVLEHEVFERRLMRDYGLGYDEAHRRAKAWEDRLRKQRTLGDASDEVTTKKAVITRTQVYRYGGRFAWTYVYTLHTDDGEFDSSGTLAQMRALAKQRGAAEIEERWAKKSFTGWRR